ncbi:hypothetical protein [Paractinoplanes atraurantiacus]|uniref:Uncharacterized protein n=1 Tax=Paractinoplanes atraurantiacus TaxID=1036182 RepID=A0A285IA03_9ACTN|nr:hypothetical protein [Actinoplanes atraurantiacus]SNY44795.1 hypothetical protein SAMN05421748_107126 [Actinoplanes atraurantiacus]
MNYFEQFPALVSVALEESWVTAFRHDTTTVTFALDAVMTTEHPRYHPPRPGEVHATEPAVLTITGNDLTFTPSGAHPNRDPNGELDFGNIDTFTLSDPAAMRWRLTGEWGELTVTRPRVSLAWRHRAAPH